MTHQVTASTNTTGEQHMITFKSFKSFGHALATAFKWVATHGTTEIAAVEATKAIVDKVLPLVPTYGGIADTIADLGYAALGELSVVITSGSAAQKQGLVDAGLDQAVITAIEAAVKSIGSIGTFLGSLKK
jgi:hypothetical protein